MGRNRLVVAVLLEHSVNVATSMQSSNDMPTGGIRCRGAKLSPSHLDRPDSCSHLSRNDVKHRGTGAPRIRSGLV